MTTRRQPTSRTLTTRFRAAVDAARTSLRDLADDAGYSPGSLDRYANRHPPGPAVAYAIADALARRGRRLIEHSARLREAAAELAPPPESDDDDAVPPKEA